MLKKMSIKVKLLTGFMTLILLFVSLLLFDINRMQVLSELTRKMHSHPLTVSKAVLRVNANIVKIHSTMKDVALAVNNEEIRKNTAIISLLEVKIFKDFEIIAKHFLGNKSMYDHPLQLFKEWKPIREEVIALMYAGQRAEAVSITGGKEVQHIEKLERSMDNLIDFCRNKASEFLEDAERTKDDALILLYILFATATLIAVLFSLMLTRGIMGPLNILKAAAVKVGRGELDAEIDVLSKDEIGELAKNFDEMRLKLKKSYGGLEEKVREKTVELISTIEKLQRLNLDMQDTQNAMLNLVGDLEDSKSKLELEIEERKNVENELKKHRDHFEELVEVRTGELKESNKELKVAIKEMEAFSYSISHDLKAPLRAITGFSNILLENYSDSLDAEGRRILNVVNSNSLQAGQLIEDILMYSRISRHLLNKTEIDIKRLAEGIFTELKQEYPERTIHFNEGPLPPCEGDAVMIKQVLTNLLSNAVKFTKPREVTEIEIGSRKIDNKIAYYIKDNGVGFDMKYAEKTFGLFQRLHSSKEFEGTGVGLAIVQQLVRRHEGRVWAEGKVNEGATFYFTL